jgi:cellobiose-specific phosphotransferase system component IIB
MIENNIKDKSILLIAPVFYNYHDLIINSLTKQGANVSFIKEKQYGVVSKFLGYMSSYGNSFYNKLLLRSRINNKAHENYDYVLVIHGEYVDKKILDVVRLLFKEAKLIAYHWDSFTHNKNGLLTSVLYDTVYSFDRSDVRSVTNIVYLPLFHTIDNFAFSQIVKEERDLLFIGVDYSDRITIVKEIAKKCNELLLKFDHFLISSKISYFRKKASFHKRYKNAVIGDFKFAKISHNDFLDKIRTSKCVLDINVEGQAGLTMRTIEVLALGKKLITTNDWIRFEPFYDENLICIIDRNNPIVEKDFFNVKASRGNMDSYHIDNWVRLLFR